ncbi:MAG: hypothetical protein BWY06_02341 [Candidatus Latescibacteria bacterium ADurb.Bin168]|nr:MAG: hypothetical protein BWY06_02341 [Candidatus Latescibacteria bacterium ADurb.Bin168]
MRETSPTPGGRRPTRGVVLALSDITSWSWPEEASAAGLTTIATHGMAGDSAEFMQSEVGEEFRTRCERAGVEIEHELHAARELLPRELVAHHPDMFRMNEAGDRVPDANLCVHSQEALEMCCQNATALARALAPTTGRHFFWIDDGQPMCRCPRCRSYSDSDQALILENRLLTILRKDNPEATLAHLAYANTLWPPTDVKPLPGVFLEFAPIQRRYDLPFGVRDARSDREKAPSHGEQLDALDANLELFGAEGAQALEYWLDVSRFSGWNRANVARIAWDKRIVEADATLYHDRGVRNVTTFAVWLDGDYVRRFGTPLLREYGDALRC